MFNKPSDWTFRDWRSSEARYLLNEIRHNVLEWIWSDDMTDEEKEKHPEYKTIDGYLKQNDNSKCIQSWWDNLSDHEKRCAAAGTLRVCQMQQLSAGQSHADHKNFRHGGCGWERNTPHQPSQKERVYRSLC